jgi:Fe2+ or Zn2+ uptake regulation protein/Fe2+ transport system protein FeoA
MRVPFGEASAAVRASGGRMTVQRRLILDVLNELSGHPTAEEIFTAARRHDPALNVSTVYRTLAWLENAGLVSHCHLDSGPDGEHSERYDPVTPVEHHHFVCTACSRVIEFESPRIETIKAEFAQGQGADVQRAALTLYGLCAECRHGGRSEQMAGSVFALQALSALPAGRQVVVDSLEGGHEFRSRLANLGFTAGARLKIVQNYGHGPMLVSLRGTLIALGRAEAARVVVAAEE